METVTKTPTGHVVGATYRSGYWGYMYRVLGVGLDGEGVRVLGVQNHANALACGTLDVEGLVWEHGTCLSTRDVLIPDSTEEF